MSRQLGQPRPSGTTSPAALTGSGCRAGPTRLGIVENRVRGDTGRDSRRLVGSSGRRSASRFIRGRFSARQMVLHAIESGDLPAPSELEQIEGRIWVPEPTRYHQTTAPPPEGIALAVTPSPMETTRMEPADVVRVVGILADAGIECWLDGGWGVDALVGRQTRPHEDLDLVVAMSDISASIGALEGKGFAMKEDLRPCSFTMVTRDHRKVDIHPVIWDDEGGGVQAQPNNSTWTYPARGFHGVGRVDGETLRCLTAEVQIQCHAGYDLDASDLQDLAALRSVLTNDSPDAKSSLA